MMSSGDQLLFTYGTLMIPETISIISGERCIPAFARLSGYSRFQVRNAPYPVIVPHEGGTVPGYVFSGLTEAGLKKLDEYEATLFERIRCTVAYDDGSQGEVWTYALFEKYRSSVIEEPWDAAAYLKGRLPEYIERLRQDSEQAVNS